MAPLQAILAVLVGASLVAAAPALESATGHRLNRRQGCFNPGTGSPLPIRSDWQTELIGDGDPHQSYKYMQLTDNTDCNGNVGCEIAQTEVEGRSFGWSAGVSGGGWISGGFEVTEYSETGQVANCQGETGDVICVYWRAAYTDYAVHQRDLCGFASPARYDDVISSPNTGDKGSAFLCGRGAQCENKGHEFVVNNLNIAGGPQGFPFEDDTNLGDI